MNKTRILNIKISRERWINMKDDEQSKYVEMLLSNMTKEQKIKMAEIGHKVVKDDILSRANDRPRNALRTMARTVGVNIEDIK